ncbi:GNAT family N-acetyltransferase [Clostridium tunisiense]|uniref:GNAT family N-acetyltransferase n=1 Tax=Clostridium tunisiense TaxID=219748 RepID=UPI0002EB6EF3|nr:GNAT family N-acetyltransferase [Clostridium tunisiense]
MKIRLLAIEDYEKVYDLWTNTKGMGMRSLDDSYEGIEKFLKRNPTTNFVVEADNNLVGVILCGHDGRRGYIYHTAVNPDYRRKGLGEALVSAALEALKKEGINKAALVVFSNNDVGNKFWESIGFEKREDLIYRNISINKNNI